ncbi:MAG TPA: polysaccharide biosynthesis C-terminal domain-containing protein [Flavobacteriales bacterium]|nr:polysaccharide biosynthesis C-terminal domain-containing protein [Flavobacteriales bacterium]
MGTRVYVGVILLITLGLHTQYLGAEVLGKLAIFSVALTFNHLLASVFSGPAVVYIGNRISINKLVMPTLIWVILSVTVLTIVQTLLGVIPQVYVYHLLALSFFFSVQTFLEQVLLSQQKVTAYNLSTFIHNTVLFLGTLIFIFYNNWRDEYVYFYSFYIAIGITTLFLFVTTRKVFQLKEFGFSFKIASTIFNYGIWIQVNNFVQTFNYRLGLLLLDVYFGKKVVGNFHAALKLAEAIWIIAKSLATVQYAKIAANNSKQFAVDLTMLMAKASFVFSLAAAIVLILIPEPAIGYLLGKDFLHVKQPIVYLLPGILFFSVSLIYCHYFSGLGKFYYNTAGSVIALVIISAISAATVPAYGIEAAALASSCGLLGMFIFNVFILVQYEKIPVAKILPGRNDLKKSMQLLKEYLGKSNG